MSWTWRTFSCSGQEAGRLEGEPGNRETLGVEGLAERGSELQRGGSQGVCRAAKTPQARPLIQEPGQGRFPLRTPCLWRGDKRETEEGGLRTLRARPLSGSPGPPQTDLVLLYAPSTIRVCMCYQRAPQMTVNSCSATGLGPSAPAAAS